MESTHSHDKYDIKDRRGMLDQIDKHDNTAGILPPRIHDVLLSYKCLSQKETPTDAQVKTMRKEVSTQNNRFEILSSISPLPSENSGVPRRDVC